MTALADLSRDERIALARATIQPLLAPDDQFHPEHRHPLEAPTLVEFRILVEAVEWSFDLGKKICAALSDAGLVGAKPSTHGYSDGYCLKIRVPVGEP